MVKIALNQGSCGDDYRHTGGLVYMTPRAAHRSRIGCSILLKEYIFETPLGETHPYE
jgi:hypothetical protein